MFAINLVTPKAAAKHEHLFNKPVSGHRLALRKPSITRQRHLLSFLVFSTKTQQRLQEKTSCLE
jgi:hypothetical protein